jgi:hypothetical protein
VERSRAPIATRVTAFTPVLVLIVTTIASRTYSDALFTKPPDILGIPLGAAVDGVAMLWMLIGAALSWDAPSPVVRGLATFVFTLPATILVVLLPALLLMLKNLP